MTLSDWFLLPNERGNAATDIDRRRGDGQAWTTGNLATPLIHGARYFRRLYEEMCELEDGDQIYFTDWRGDSDERLAGPGTEVAKVLTDLASKGVQIRGLVWRSHPLAFSEAENLNLAEQVNEKGGVVLLDERVRRGGSHHQKLFLIRHLRDANSDVAFLGGIDLCHSRNDDAEHLGDPQVYDLDKRYGDRPPWHDAQIQIRGPAINDVAVTFRERWSDPTSLDHRNPLRRVMRKRSHEPDDTPPLPPLPRDPKPQGSHAVQILRTYPEKKPPFPFAPNGERSIARAYHKAYERAQSLIYIEDQYFWSSEVPGILAQNLRDKPNLHLIVVLPRYPEKDGAFSAPPNLFGQIQALETVQEAGGDRAAFYNLENRFGTPIYVHAKVCVVDDVWAAIGSDNVNLRSWTHDSELSCSVIDETLDEREPKDPGGLGDGARRFARDLRLELWREHLGGADGADLIDPTQGFHTFKRVAQALEDWHVAGKRGTRPPGHARPHEPDDLPRWVRRWAGPIYRTALDPDGRPRDLRKANLF
ncbi:MAG: phospholipase D family protein [Actinomycetota bacterium]